MLNRGCGVGPINLFFAGAGFPYDLLYDVGVRKRLLSWHANPEEEIEDYIENQRIDRESFGICDSGAFTVWNKGGRIDVNEYGRVLITLLEFFDIAANLDVIPGKKGMPARDITPAINEAAASEGWSNFLLLREMLKANGIEQEKLMPIYHQGESIEWLMRMIDIGCEYIGISPSNDCQTKQRMYWLDDVFDYLTVLSKPLKTHGYAVTSPVLMENYPWFSVDSASWVMGGGYGIVQTPYGIVTMSDREDVMNKPQSMDGRDWTPEMKKKVYAYFESIGLDPNKLRTSYDERWKANAIYMLSLEKSLSYKPRKKPASLF